MNNSSIESLFLFATQDMLNAEYKILNILPKLEACAKDPMLRLAFSSHRHETEGQILRLEDVFGCLGRPPTRSIQGDAMLVSIGGMVDQRAGNDHTEITDSTLILLAQAIENYEIARYSTLIVLAKKLLKPKAVKLLRETLEEERAAENQLLNIAEVDPFTAVVTGDQLGLSNGVLPERLSSPST